jgi:ribonuclease D
MPPLANQLPTAPFPKRISKEEVRDLPLADYKGAIHIVTSAKSLKACLPKLLKEPVLGFDTETRPSFRKGVAHPIALLQFATQDAAYLIRLNQIGFSEGLQELLSSPNVVKAGVAIHDDIKGLQDLAPFVPQGFVELSALARKLGIVTCGLRNLAGIFLNLRVSKKAQLTNWEQAELTESQLQYAATDAWISREIYLFLQREGWLSSK